MKVDPLSLPDQSLGSKMCWRCHPW